MIFSERLLYPIFSSESKQKKFIDEAARELRSPLTIISLDKEKIKDDFGESDATRSIDKQVRKMLDLTLRLNEIAVFEKRDIDKKETDISYLCRRTIAEFKQAFEVKAINFSDDIQDGVKYSGDGDLLSKMLFEIVENGLKFSIVFEILSKLPSKFIALSSINTEA